jgi:hypothetical protein
MVGKLREVRDSGIGEDSNRRRRVQDVIFFEQIGIQFQRGGFLELRCRASLA